MLVEFSKSYEPKEIENKIYEWWEKNGFFTPEKQRELGLVQPDGPRFCITIPPPNVTGALHLGHALTESIEDLMTRFERMRQKETLYIPGCDHAGIATQNVVERELSKKGIKRKDLGREKFIEKVWEWKSKYHARITEQIKHLGVSCDWSRERFTLDKDLSKAVRTAFVHLYKKQAIFRGTYMVNWCPGRCESAISDLEAIAQETPSHLWYIKYPLISDTWSGPKHPWGSGKWAEGATEFIELATTRPETLMGDTAVATNKKSKKMKALIGKTAVLPVNNRKIPIIDDDYVDPSFGTGALKITPAHDPNDYEIGKRHGLEIINIFSEKGVLLPEHSGKYAGMDRFKCRDAVVEDLKKEGLLTKIEDYTHDVAHCQRCDAIVEPRVSTQWFVETKYLAQAALDQVSSGMSTMIPSREEQRFKEWMEKIKPWCISRQLWWGHRIPVWYCSNNHEICELEDPVKCPKCGDTTLRQDEDVLDTWFSSGLWPFSTLGWPNTENPDFKRFYPTDMRETGYDILFFWVAREMMLGVELTKTTPYRTIYFHGMVRTKEGKKVSKSMEDIAQYDPLNLIEKFGADALRFTLISNTTAGRDLNLNASAVEAARKFCNKIWQSVKFVMGNLQPNEIIPRLSEYPLQNLKDTDIWILSRFHKLIQSVSTNLEKYDYLNPARDLKKFYWEEFCDWYLEITKIQIYNENEKDKTTPKVVLLYIIENYLRLLHPFMPFITEALWHVLPDNLRDGPAVIVAKWPEASSKYIKEEKEGNVARILDIIHEIRRTRTDYNVPLGTNIPLLIESGDKSAWIESMRDVIITLAHVDGKQLRIEPTLTAPHHASRIVQHGLTIYVPLEGLINMQAELARIEKQLANVGSLIEKSQKKLAGPFAQNADPEVVEEEREKLKELEQKKAQLEEQIATLK